MRPKKVKFSFKYENMRIFSETAKFENFGQAQDTEMCSRFVYVVYTKNNTQIR